MRSKFNGWKVCGRTDGSNFLTAKRPRGGDGKPYACPTGTIPCGGEENLNNGNHENVICSVTTDECPITGLTFGTTQDEDGNDVLTVEPIMTPDKLPLSQFKLSSSLPCISYTQQPSTNLGQLTDEYTYAADGCINDDFLGTALDSRYEQVPDFSVN